MSKLSDDQAEEIRTSALPIVELAYRYKVSTTTIRNIQQGITHRRYDMDEADIAAALERAKMTDEEKMSASQKTYLHAAEATKEAAYQASGEAAAVAKEASKKAERLKKPLPQYVQPVVALMEEMREAVALYCREYELTFGYMTNKLWLDFLKKEGRVPADLPLRFPPRHKRALRAVVDEKQHTIDELRSQLKAAKEQTEDLSEDVKKIPC